MKGKHIYLFALFLFLFMSCSRTDIEGEEQFLRPSFSATYCLLEDDLETKNTIGNVNYTVLWSSGDKIAIVNLTQKKKYKYEVTNPGNALGLFQPSEGVIITAADFVDGDKVCAVYPYDAAEIIDGGGELGRLYVTLTDRLSYTSRTNSEAFSKNDIQVSSLITIDTGDLATPIEINLRRQVAFVTISSHISEDAFKDISIQSVTISADHIAGRTEITFPSTDPVIDNNAGSESSMTVLPASKKLSTISETVQFAPVFPGSLSEGITFILETTDYYVGFHRQGTSSLKKSTNNTYPLFSGAYTQVASQAEATFDKSWWIALKGPGVTPSGNAGGFGNPAGANPNGSDAGGFGNPNGANPGGSNAGGFENPNGASPNGNNAGSFTAE